MNSQNPIAHGITMIELEPFPNSNRNEVNSAPISDMNQLSSVHEAENEESKYESSPIKHSGKSPASGVDNNNGPSADYVPGSKRSEKSSEAFVDYNYVNSERNINEKEEVIKDNNSHFSPLVDMKVEPNSESGDNLSVELEDKNTGKKLRDEPTYKKYKWLIFPDDSFKGKWEMILAIMILYSCLWVPYYLAFTDNETSFTLTMDGISDFIFFIDVLVNFNSALYDDQDVLVFKRSEIALIYIKFWFWLDLTSAFPYSFLIEYQNTDRNLKFQKMIKMTRFLRIFKMIKERNRLLKYLNSVLRISSGGAENILGPIVIMACFCHISACFYYLLCASEDVPDNWIANYIDNDSNVLYLTSFYWVTQTVVTTGYGDIPCITSYERMFSICLMFIGVLVYSFCVGSLSNFLIALDEQNEIFNERLVTLYSMKHYYNLDFFLCKKVERFLRYGKKTQDRELQKEFVLELPKNLKIELSAIIYKNLIDGIEFFKNKPKRFMAFVCPYLKSMKFKEGDILVDEGDHASEMYFLKSGAVAVVLKKYGFFKFMHISNGNYFGEVDLLFSKVRNYTFQAETDCELLSMTKKDFLKVFFKEFKEIGAEIYRSAVKKRAQMKEASEKAERFCHKRKMTVFKRNSQLNPNNIAEHLFYKKATMISTHDDNEDLQNNEDEGDSSVLSSPHFKKEKENVEKKEVIKLQKVEMDSISQNSENPGLEYEKKLIIVDEMNKIEERLENIEEIIKNFFSTFENEKVNENEFLDIGNIDELRNSCGNMDEIKDLSNAGLETLSEGKEKNSVDKKKKKNSHFYKSKEN